MTTQDQLKEALERKEALRHYLDVDNKKIEVEEEELRTHVADFWDDRDKAEAQMRKIKELHFWIDSYEEIDKMCGELELAFDFVKEGLMTEDEVDELHAQVVKTLEKLELRNMLRREEDKLGVVLKINSGAGGTESQDWAQMLMRMYLRYAERHGYKTSIAQLLEGDEAGIKSVTINIEGYYAYG
ncbi:MAG: PCRF domain-containing protein, partial [Muribaculaceae bacterium]|nr:PCRF domain-containing protein [Muribaculaceae bacterium]